MEFAKLSTVITRLGSRYELLGCSLFHSTAASMLTRREFRIRGKNSLNALYRRISPVGDPKISVVPILDQWIDEGRSVDKGQLQVFIKELRYYKRYTHALEISMWMSDKRYLGLTSRDVAVRLDLMSKVHGIEKVEKYFDNIPQNLKGIEVYGALLNCYAYVKSVDKAEAVMQKIRDLSFAESSLTYNVMLNLYHRTGNFEKFNGLIQDMEENSIVYDKFTLGILLNSYAASSDIKKMEKTFSRMESDAKVALDWYNYAIMANAYTKAGLIDRALEMLKKSEGLITAKRSVAYNCLLTRYAAIGKKDEVLRIWEIYKKEKVYNKGYMSLMNSLLKLDDIEGAEKIFIDWESQNLVYDMHIPNILISAYSSKGLVEKAEIFVDRAISKGGKPNVFTWYYLATGYLRNDQASKAVEMMKKALVAPVIKLKPSSESLACCLEYLKRKGELEKAEEFINLLLDRDIISCHVQQKLLNNIRSGKSRSGMVNALSDNDSAVENENKLEFSEFDGDSSGLVSEEKC